MRWQKTNYIIFKDVEISGKKKLKTTQKNVTENI